MPLSRLMRQMTLFQNPVKYRRHCVQTSTSSLCTSVTAIWPNWNVERTVQHHCGWSNCRWSSFSILLLFTWAVSSQWVNRAVHSVGFTSTWSACGYWQVPYYRSPSRSLCSVLCSSLLLSFSHWCVCIYDPPLSPFLLALQQSFKWTFFSPIQSVCNRWFLPDSTQLLTGCPRYDLLAFFQLMHLLTVIHESQR